MNDKVKKNYEILENIYTEQELVRLTECINTVLVEFCENEQLAKSHDLLTIQPLARLNMIISESLLDSHDSKYNNESEVSHE